MAAESTYQAIVIAYLPASESGRRNDGGRVRDLRGMLTLVHPGESIRPDVLRPRSVGQYVIEAAEQLGQECNWVDLLVLLRPLGQDGSDARV